LTRGAMTMNGESNASEMRTSTAAMRQVSVLAGSAPPSDDRHQIGRLLPATPSVPSSIVHQSRMGGLAEWKNGRERMNERLQTTWQGTDQRAVMATPGPPRTCSPGESNSSPADRHDR
jgi:hypothetical protein